MGGRVCWRGQFNDTAHESGLLRPNINPLFLETNQTMIMRRIETSLRLRIRQAKKRCSPDSIASPKSTSYNPWLMFSSEVDGDSAIDSPVSCDSPVGQPLKVLPGDDILSTTSSSLCSPNKTEQEQCSGDDTNEWHNIADRQDLVSLQDNASAERCFERSSCLIPEDSRTRQIREIFRIKSYSSMGMDALASHQLDDDVAL